jgi:hypothetical protein
MSILHGKYSLQDSGYVGFDPGSALFTIILLIDSPSATAARPEDLGSRYHDGGYLFICSICGRTHSDLQDIVKRILKQTIECGYFIQEYARRNTGGKQQLYKWCNEKFTQYRAGRAITQAFSGMDDQIAAFCAAFNLLKQNFDSRVNLDTALVLSRTTVTIDAISA